MEVHTLCAGGLGVLLQQGAELHASCGTSHMLQHNTRDESGYSGFLCINSWKLYRKKGIVILERVQRRATKMIKKIWNINYEMHLKECGLTTLETRRLRGDQI